MSFNLDALAGKYVLERYTGRAVSAFLARRFAGNARRRLVIYYEPKSISFTQVFPFLYYADALKDRYGLEIRCVSNADLVKGVPPRADHADTVLLQVWFDLPEHSIQRALGLVKAANPTARIGFVDSFAHSDLRLARYLEPHIDFYLKKSVFRDREDVFRPFRGDTNLTEYYGGLYGIAQDPVDWQVPRGILKKLRLSPNFFTAPRFLEAFATQDLPPWQNRPLDIQTRFGIQGSDWYRAMRQHALNEVQSILGLRLSSPERVSYKQYMDEMRQSKLCFSPHGYGELCWRDIEGVLAGAVLIKPDMSHLETLPDIYRPGVTYLPVKWDFSDLEKVARTALADPDMCREITANAYRTITEYVRRAEFVNDVSFLFVD